MNNPKILSFFESEITPLFPLSSGSINWTGGGEANAESEVYYFNIDGEDYIILSENYIGASDQIEGNLIPPHQKAEIIAPTAGDRQDVYVAEENHPNKQSCYISVYKIK